jgi:two-component system, LytTR family, response regulator
MNIRCIIVDDEPYAVELLEQYVNKIPYLTLQQKCYTAFEAWEYLKKEKSDLVFLDINMPKVSGLEFAGMLENGPQIIFTTAYSNYAVQSYERNAVDYLLKPITFDRFMTAVSRAAKRLSNNEITNEVSAKEEGDFIFLKTGKAIIKTEFGKIKYIEGMKDYVVVHTTTDKIVIYNRMKALEELLPHYFHRIHKSFIVNLEHVQKIVDNHVVIDDFRIPISTQHRKEFIEIVNRKML